MTLRALVACLLITFTVEIMADTVTLRPDHPQTYTVRKGDTLWDISSKFLTDPWKWPEIWEVNPQIQNPDLIYPGDIINLIYVDGQPRLVLTRGKIADNKLTPQIRETLLSDAIYVIPVNEIRQFLTKPKIVGEKELKAAPYIVEFANDHIIGGAGDSIYVRAIESGDIDGYNVFRAGQTYRDFESKEILGYEAIYVGETRLTRTGDPATLLLTRTDRETLVGDRLLPVEQERIDFRFEPRVPDSPVNGHIIAVYEGVSQIGQYQVVAIDRGVREGLKKGHLLDIYRAGKTVRDIVSEKRRDKVTLPEEKTGRLMVFRAFEKLSYGLVIAADYPMHIYDAVRTP